MVLNVASPTPIVLMFEDSTSVIFTLSPRALFKYAAVIQPEEPPPTMTILRIFSATITLLKVAIAQCRSFLGELSACLDQGWVCRGGDFNGASPTRGFRFHPDPRCQQFQNRRGGHRRHQRHDHHHGKQSW